MKKFFPVVSLGVIFACSSYLVQAVPITKGPFTIMNRQSGLCLDSAAGGNNTPIIQNPCNASTVTQQFTFLYVDEYFYIMTTVSPPATPICLTVSSPVAGAPIIQYTCGMYYPQPERPYAQQFRIHNLNDGFVALQSHLELHFVEDRFNPCLSIQYGNPFALTPAVIWPCLDYDQNKQFTITAVTN